MSLLRSLKSLKLWMPILPFVLFYLGAFCNILAITVNHGTMPVTVPLGMDPPAPGTLLDGVHAQWSNGVHLAFLCDWIVILHATGVCSPGDLLLWAGDFLQIPMFFAWLSFLVYGTTPS